MDTFPNVVHSLAPRQYGSVPAPVASSITPSPSSTPTDTTAGTGSTASAVRTGLLPLQQYIAAHAILCVLGFLVLLPVGAIVARWMRTNSDRWFRIHWVIQWVLAMPIIITGFALGVTSVAKNDHLPLNDTHKKWGVALFFLYLVQLSLGAFIHFVKVPFLSLNGRSLQNYLHAGFGVFIIGAAFYQVRTGFRTEWPLYTGLTVKNGANVAWIIWLVLVIAVYVSGLWLLPRQFRQERTARRNARSRLGLESDSTELVVKRHGQM
ncbi:uncharacterized protein PHACADRAFT_262655 [Phanerochaete carnosa HHB-10118-sp]|uniref:Cytochrome b561 domain-containing protein n=1 Tax=Phanerochaete carnosa (strain HHB-10118-sp) TaxID=650164 RepID=K5VZU2_PHACS|nr:uncharacterized protein PHACADRAFT_262655 [Phanerochaete carnosa HHB-10118-sp]EKM52144.1 hypothetical protein PHACADRAFT_262655 [Phanerochaete carnosa HHB-10118-sp]